LSSRHSRFYGRDIKASQLLSGAVPIPGAALGLIAVIEAAEGKPVDRNDFPADVDVAPSEAAPPRPLSEEEQAAIAASESAPSYSEYGVGGVPGGSGSSGAYEGQHPSTAPLLQSGKMPSDWPHAQGFNLDDEDERIRRHSVDVPPYGPSPSDDKDQLPSYKQQRDSLKARGSPAPPLPARRRPVSTSPAEPGPESGEAPENLL
jgi:hypothetical protein